MHSLRRSGAGLLIVATLLAGSATACKDKKKEPSISKITPGTTATTVGINLCGLLTPADLKTALGSTFAAGEMRSAVQCQWKTAAGDITFTVTLAAADYAATKRTVSGSGAPVEDVTGVGDQAFSSATPTALLLVATNGPRVVVFGYTAPTVNATTAKPKVIALAKQALAKL
ncbi:MAG TPA: hypothetical protein VFB78_17870 [Acidimicrobiales bacterium]|nr:hypothetical protein [Acidimicrobiales bacterium]